MTLTDRIAQARADVRLAEDGLARAQKRLHALLDELSLPAVERGPHPEMRDVMRSICDEEGVPVADVLSDNRKRVVARVRQRIMCELVEADRWSLTQIGRALRRDHTTVLHGARAHAGRASHGHA